MRTLRQVLIAGVFLTLWSLLAQAGINDGLVGYWSFDVCDVRDDSGNGFNAGRTVGNPICVAGAQGFAFEFDGNDYIRIPGVPVVPTRHSYALGFRSSRELDRSSPRQDILYADTDEEEILQGRGRPHITMNHDGDGKIGFHPRIITNGGNVLISNSIESTTTEWQADRWYHVAFTWDGQTFRTYIDGELQQAATLQSGLSFVYEGIVLAIRGDGEFPFTGALDEVRLYDRVITQSEVRELSDRAFFSLTVIPEGEGAGRVNLDPPNFTCEDSYSQDYADGTSVTLTALPEEGSEFAGWSGGGCSGTQPCTVAVDRTRTVRAAFDLRTFALHVRKRGDGDGAVTSDPPGIDCGDSCSHDFEPDTVVTLVAVPDADSIFIGWSGAGCEGPDTCTVTLSRNRTVTANFIRLYPLTITLGGTQDGSVTSDPAGIDCGEDCEEIYESGTRVTLTAQPGPTSSFGRWSGSGCSGSDPECRVNVNRARDIEAVFDLLRFRLRANKSGSGEGRITSEPRGINCGGDCGNTYDIGTVVTLTATPDSDSVFLGWEGGGCSGTGTCTVTMTEDLTVVGIFERLFSLTVSKTRIREADGTVVSDPLGIDCGETCEQRFLNETTVTLSATPGVNARFVRWEGEGCSGEAPTCTVQMDRTRTVTATFAPIEFELNVTKMGTGTGTVSSSPSGLSCGDDCDENFDIGTEVTLSAIPDSDSAFTGWGGACSGTATCTITMTANTQVTAKFERLFSLTVSKTRIREADGTVVSDPSGIDCGDSCEQRFLNGTTVTLSATPGVNARFVSWEGGGCTGEVATCTVQMDQPRTVRATFAPIEFELNVTNMGTGTGAVSSSPSGVNCGEDCDENFDIGTEVTLSAIPDSDSIFAGWGGACSGTATCTITMTANTQVTAKFERLYLISIATVRIGEGDGTVTSSPAGIDCGTACQTEFPHHTEVTLTATPEADTRFVGWSGDGCSGDTPCTVIVTSALAITATFENPSPVASTGVDQTVDEGSLVTLDGSNSTDFNTNVDRYAWTQVSGPMVALSDPTAALVTFTAPPVLQDGAILEFRLEVFDRRGLSATDHIRVSVLDTNIPPLADAGSDRMVEELTLVTLDGSQSSDMDGALENILWTQTAGASVLLSDPTALQPTFTSPIAGLSVGFEPGDTLPGFVLRHEPQGSIADIQAQGSYAEAQWSVMFTRALRTPDIEGDVQFDFTLPDHVY